MRPLSEIENSLESFAGGGAPGEAARMLLRAGEETLEHWIAARGEVPTNASKEGFRLLALHRQGARGDPSFNACRETCRELAYHYNLLSEEAKPQNIDRLMVKMSFIAKHLYYFVSGKLEQDKLGDFCCSSRPLRGAMDETHNEIEAQHHA